MPHNLENDPHGGGLHQTRMAGNSVARAKSNIENAEELRDESRFA
jgi:hypothetical protein